MSSMLGARATGACTANMFLCKNIVSNDFVTE